MRISYWSSDVCSSDLVVALVGGDILRLVALRRRRGGVHERHQRATLAAHDQRRETVEPRLPTGVEADRLREIDIAAEAGEAAVIPIAAPVLHPDAVLAIGAPVADRRVAGADDARLGDRKGVAEGQSGSG